MVDAGRILIRGLIIIAAMGMLTMGCSAGGTALKDDGPAGLAKIKNIDVNEAEGATTVLLTLDRPVTFTSVKLSDPPMMVVDLAGVELDEGASRLDVGKEPVLYINPTRDTVSKRIARLEIGLTRSVATSVTQDGPAISILFDKTSTEATADAPMVAPASMTDEVVDAGVVTPAETPAAAADVTVEAAAADAPDAAAPAKAGEEAVASAPLPAATTVKDISIASSGKSVTVVVEGDGSMGEHKAFMLGKDRLVLDVFGVGSAKDKDTIKVDGECVKQVRMASHSAPDEKVRVVLDLGCEVDYEVNSSGSSVVVAVAPRGSKVVAAVKPSADVSAPSPIAVADNSKTAAAMPEAPAKTAATKVDTSMSAGRKVTVSLPPSAEKEKETPTIYITQKDGNTVLSTAPEYAAAGDSKVISSDQDVVVTKTKIYTGGKISFDIQDAALDKVIKLLADVAGLNLIMDPADVTGRVTLKLANVPWDQALDILLKIYNLDKVIEGNVLRVAPKNKLAEEKKIDLRAIAEQKRLMEEAEDLYTKTFKVNYADAGELEDKVRKILSKRGESTSNPRTNELIITDVKDKIVEAGDLISILDKEVNQILIEARIVTVDVGYTQSLGVSWGLTKRSNTSNPNAGLVSGGEGLESGTGGPNNAHDYQLNLPAAVDAAAGASGGILGAMSWGSILRDVNIDLTIQALETIDKAETLAAPKVLTLENKSAQITQGTTLYVQTTSASGTKPEPLNANLSLTVTPRVTGDNYIIMDVNATNNTPSTPPPGSTAAIETQAVQTNIIVKDGDTIVLGGIYIKNKSKADSQVPWLGRIPVIGWLFRQRNDSDSTSELLIFITPKLVKQQPVRV